MNHGTLKTTHRIDENSSLTDSLKYRDGHIQRGIRTYRIRVQVENSKEEMTQFIRFTEEVTKLRNEGKLTTDNNDPYTHPSFVLEFPKEDKGSYFIIKTYSVFLDI